jgi:hypothetical protein
VPQRPQELGWPLQVAASDEFWPPLEAKSENFLVNRLDPHFGQEAPLVRLERTSISESAPHFPQ